MTLTGPTVPIELHQVNHKGKNVLGLFFPHDRQRIEQVKSLPDRKYSFVLYLTAEKILEADVSDVNHYLSDLAGRKVSESLIHTAINALKFYYEQVHF